MHLHESKGKHLVNGFPATTDGFPYGQWEIWGTVTLLRRQGPRNDSY